MFLEFRGRRNSRGYAEEVLMRFHGRLFYETSDGERRLVAPFDFEAADPDAAERLVLEESWDHRLDSAGCRPVFVLHTADGAALAVEAG
jgi:hypothetical protein